MDNLRVVWQVQNEHQLFANYRKCEFLLRSIAFLCHILSSEGVEVEQRKIKAIKKFPRTSAPTDIRSFLGPDSFYRRFFGEFASIASHLTTFTKKSFKFEWSEAYEKSFQMLIDRHASAAVFTLPASTKGFAVYCDLS